MDLLMVDNDTEPSAKRKRTDSSQSYLTDLPNGIVFFSLMNEKKNFFVPSTKNYFGGIKVAELKSDSGCNTMLLPIISLSAIFEKFPRMHFRYEIKNGNGTAGRLIALTLEHKDFTKSFDLEIAKDLIPNPIVISSKILRFSLCEEDKNVILNSEYYKPFFSNLNIDKLRESDIAKQIRRSTGLLGQSILSQMASIKYVKCELYVNPTKFKLPSSFEELELIIENIKGPLSHHLPEGFNDWEDDDFDFEDDERQDIE